MVSKLNEISFKFLYAIKIKVNVIKGCLMVFGWMFCASTAILVARYYKFLFPNVKICNVQFWFVIHRPLMMSVPAIMIAAFLVIFSNLNLTWIDSSDGMAFAHSLTGATTIGLSLLQVRQQCLFKMLSNNLKLLFFCVKSQLFQILIASFRPDKDHPRRKYFNYFHRTVGISTYLLASKHTILTRKIHY